MKVVGPIPEGGIVLLSGIAPGGEDPEWQEHVVDALVDITGHSRFVLLSPSDGDVEVWGPDVDLKAKLTGLLAADQAQRTWDLKRTADLAAGLPDPGRFPPS